jgi:hypothetical protein
MPVVALIQSSTSVQIDSMVRFWIRTMPMMAIARNDSSIFGLSRNHSSLSGLRVRTAMASFGQALMQLAHRLQFALVSMVRGKLKSGQPGWVAVPL